MQRIEHVDSKKEKKKNQRMEKNIENRVKRDMKTAYTFCALAKEFTCL